jgi:hypothetical protein
MARPEGSDRARTLRLARGGRDEDDPEAADEGPGDEGPRPAA